MRITTSHSVAAPAVSQAPKSRLGSSDRLTLRDVVRLGTFNCRTLLSEIRQQKLIRFMESRQIDVLAIQEHRMVLLDPNEVPMGDDVCNGVGKATSAVTANAGVVAAITRN